MFLVQDAGLAVCSSSPTLGSTPGAAGAERRTRDSAFPFLSSGWSPDLFLDVVSGPILDFANPLQHTRCSRCRALGQRLCWVFLLSSGTRGAAGYGVQLVQNAGLALFFIFFAFLFRTIGSTRGAADAERMAGVFALLFISPSGTRLQQALEFFWYRTLDTCLAFLFQTLGCTRSAASAELRASDFAFFAWIPIWSPDLSWIFSLFLGVVSGPLLGLASGLAILLGGGGLRTSIRSIVLVSSCARALLGCGLRTIICFGQLIILA